jgi:CCR4-NOT complex subunit CAF16
MEGRRKYSETEAQRRHTQAQSSSLAAYINARPQEKRVMVVSLRNVAFTYRLSAEPVLSDVSLNVGSAARVVLVGANGAGKSTLLRLIAGRRRVTAGSAKVFEEDAFEMTANCLRVNMVTDDWDADLSLPVQQLVCSAVGAAGAPAPRVARLLEVLGVAELLHAELHALSDGQRRRVQLFCKLLPERELILLDEATNSLDVLSRASLLAFLREESEVRGRTVIFCTHIFDGLDGWATDLAHLDGGRVRHQVSASSLPSGMSLYQCVSTWLVEYAREAQKERSAAGALPSYEAIATALLDAAARGDKDAGLVARSAPKRNRPSPKPGSEAVPDGWENRSSGMEEGGFGAHHWSPARPAGAPEVLPSMPATAEDAEGTTTQPQSKLAPAQPPEATQPQLIAKEEPPPVVERTPLEAAQRMPPDAARLVPSLQGALAMLTARIDACSTAVCMGDAGVVSAEATAISAIWTQAEKALQQFEASFRNNGEVRLSPPMAASALAAQGSGGSEPAGWGSRHNACSEADLIRQGVILQGATPP